MIIKKRFAIASLTIVFFILITVSTAYAFDPLVAGKNTLDLAKYFIIFAIVIGAIKALYKSQFWAALLVFIVGGVIYSSIDPETMKNLGSSILSYLTIIGNKYG